jgi:hypothetical protein
MGHDVDLPLVLPVRQRGGQDLPALADARVVEEYLNQPVMVFGGFDECIDAGLIAHIAGNAQAADLGSDGFGAVAVQIRHHDLCPASREVAGAGGTDAGCTAGDDCDFIFPLHERSPFKAGA